MNKLKREFQKYASEMDWAPSEGTRARPNEWHAWNAGALYGYRKAIELLRGEPDDQMNRSGKVLADWLESQLDEPKENNR